MSEQELIILARQQGATHYSRLFKSFYRRNQYGWIEAAKIQPDGTLSKGARKWKSAIAGLEC